MEGEIIAIVKLGETLSLVSGFQNVGRQPSDYRSEMLGASLIIEPPLAGLGQSLTKPLLSRASLPQLASVSLSKSREPFAPTQHL